MATQDVLAGATIAAAQEDAVERDGMASHDLPPQWQAIKLGDVASEYISGGTPSTERPELWDGTVPWTTSAPIAEQAIELSHAQRFITERALTASATHLVPKGSLLVGTRVGVGKAVVNLLDIAISQDLTGTRLDTVRALPEFIAYQFKTGRIQDYLAGRKRGTTIKGISRFDLEAVPLYLPPLPEQRAIARALRSVQAAIQARRREVALERERKAALMQRLFTHGTRGEATKLTEIGEMPVSWRVVRLGELFEAQLGKMLSQKARAGISSRPYMRNANVQWGRVDCADVLEMDFDDGERRKFRLMRGDILICEGGEVGRTAIWEDELPECYFQKAVHRLRPRDSRMLPSFLLHHMERAFRYESLYGVAGTETTIAHLPQEKLVAMWIPEPHPDEQRDIAGVLGAIGVRIAALEHEAALLDELFRALLDALMTGRLSALPLVDDETTVGNADVAAPEGAVSA